MTLFYGSCLPKAVFRCDASAHIGSGHVMRCLTLADALCKAGWECCFLCTKETLDVVPAIAEKDYAVALPDNPPAYADVLIVDHYGLDCTYESKARQWARKILVLDDLANRSHDCDILLDQTFGRKDENYKSLVPYTCKILCGSQYALLRPQFSEMREKSLVRRKKNGGRIERILVSMGGTNIDNITGFMLEAFSDISFASFEIDIVMNSKADYINNVRQSINILNAASPHHVHMHTDVKNMARLMCQADLAIGAGGITSWERCCLGLPSILVVLADNQEKIAAELAREGAIINLGSVLSVRRPDVVAAIKNLYNAPQKMVHLSETASRICDGCNLGVVVNLLNAYVENRHA